LNTVSGFSKFTKIQKIDFLAENYFNDPNSIKDLIQSFWHSDEKSQMTFDEFSENTLTNFFFPYGVVPNLLLNNKSYCVPMVIEESSVVAAAANASNYWAKRGGVKAEILSFEKIGQIHFIYKESKEKLFDFFERVKPEILSEVSPLADNMQKRGGGILEMSLRNLSDLEKGLFQIFMTFDTQDAMGANFINSILEMAGRLFKEKSQREGISIEIIMGILSNYTPNCLVKASLSCKISELDDPKLGMSGLEFAQRFEWAVKISKADVYRATTHNKGIMNGIDSVILATGNDFRAVEACAHAYASRSGKYQGLTEISLEDDTFNYYLEIPLSLGTVGGLTSLHPLAKLSLTMLGNPDAKELMRICAAIGLLQNFSAIRSLVTSGIQKGHMKMHLLNILNHMGATDEERDLAKEYFKTRIISFKAVSEFLSSRRILQ
jgi:hydroxymethylglutaryl-CoA reductase